MFYELFQELVKMQTLLVFQLSNAFVQKKKILIVLINWNLDMEQALHILHKQRVTLQHHAYSLWIMHL